MSLNLILTQILTPKPTTKQHDIQLNIVAWGMKPFPMNFDVNGAWSLNGFYRMLQRQEGNADIS